MVKLKFVNSASAETVLIDITSLNAPVFDTVMGHVRLFSLSSVSDEQAIKKFLIENVSLQIVTKKVDFRDIIERNLNFHQIGVTGPIKIGVVVRNQGKTTSQSTLVEANRAENRHKDTEKNDNSDAEKPFERDMRAIAPSKKLHITHSSDSDDNSDPQMGVEDFKNYYETIANKAHNRKDVYKDILAQKKLQLEECHVRIKFPDRTILQARFTNSETSGTLYDFVKSQLEDPSLSFTLYFSHPLKPITCSTELYLMRDLHFDKRTSLVFESKNRKLPYLKKDIKLESIANISEKNQNVSDDNKGTNSGVSESDVGGNVSKSSDSQTKKQKFEDKMSKFLRLSKK